MKKRLHYLPLLICFPLCLSFWLFKTTWSISLALDVLMNRMSLACMFHMLFVLFITEVRRPRSQSRRWGHRHQMFLVYFQHNLIISQTVNMNVFDIFTKINENMFHWKCLYVYLHTIVIKKNKTNAVSYLIIIL